MVTIIKLLTGENSFFVTTSCGGTMKVPWDLQQSGVGGGGNCSLVIGAKGFYRRMCSN